MPRPQAERVTIDVHGTQFVRTADDHAIADLRARSGGGGTCLVLLFGAPGGSRLAANLIAPATDETLDLLRPRLR